MSVRDLAPLTPAPPGKPSQLKRFRRMAASIPDEADVIILGDSLAASWPAALYAEAFPGRRVLNLGLPGDRVQNTLWRVGQLDAGHLRPRDLVLLVGTNNLGDGDDPEQVASGIGQLLKRAGLIWGEPQALVMTVPWRGPQLGLREAARLRLNELLRTRLAPVSETLLIEADLVLDYSPPEYPSFQPDLLHLSQDGYRRLSCAVRSASVVPK